ncbi:MAG: hypothetical protein AB7F09_09915 [Parvibaculaceae bacterium]
MIYLVGGPPRVGKSTLALIALEDAGIPHCSTDMLVGMLETAAPSLGVRHGFHADKATSMSVLLTEFVRCADLGNEAYLVEGDVVMPAFATAVRSRLSAMRCVFLGNTKLTDDALRRMPDWLAGQDAAGYDDARRRIIRLSESLRDDCTQEGHPYIEMGDGWETGLAAAARALGVAT